jgi:hypothetical protein
MSMIHAYVNTSAAPHPYPHALNGSQKNGTTSPLSAVLGGNRLFGNNGSPQKTASESFGDLMGSGTFMDGGGTYDNGGGLRDGLGGGDNLYDEPRSRRH